MNISLITEICKKKQKIRYKYLKRLSLEEKLLLRKYLVLNDCIFFGEIYIKSFDKKWTSKTADFHYELIDTVHKIL